MPQDFHKRYLRRLPAVERVLQEKGFQELEERFPREVLLRSVREVLEGRRKIILQAASEEELQQLDISPPSLAFEALQLVREKMDYNLKPVLNATGVVLHTNLGRAPLAPQAVKAIGEVGRHFSNLEFSLKSGKRTTRHEHVEELLCWLTGAEDALVVNNNAGAVFLALNTAAFGREVIVSRGELVEIGGSFRIPEVMARSGARLVEVGTTNKCYLRDYRDAVTEHTALMLKVHTSNYRVLGFTAEVDPASLVRLAHNNNLPVMEDLGSGVLLDLTLYGLPREPMVSDSIAAGVDLVTFSGDKLLGGPQAGIIVGEQRYVRQIKRNQMARALRVDKLTLAALEATLRLYLDERTALKDIPVLNMLTSPAEDIKARAQRVAEELQSRLGGSFRINIFTEKARVGGGSLPLASLPSFQVGLEHQDVKSEVLASRLRMADPPVVPRVRENRVLLDMRTVRENEVNMLLDAVAAVLKGGAGYNEDRHLV